MTMRDLQSSFWEARTKRERIAAIRAEQSLELKGLQSSIRDRGIKLTRLQSEVIQGTPGVYFRVTAIPHQPLSLGRFNVFSPWLLNLCPYVGELRTLNSQSSTHSIIEGGGHGRGWTPKAHGVRCVQEGPGAWSVWDDGTVALVAFYSTADNTHYPGWYSRLAAQVVSMAERLRTRAGRPDIPFEIDAEFKFDGGVHAKVPAHFGQVMQPESNARIGPFTWSRRNEVEPAFREIEHEIWAAFSIAHQLNDEIGFDTVFKPGAWSQ